MAGEEKEVKGATASQEGTKCERATKRSTPGTGQPPAVPQEGYSAVQAVLDQPELLEIILDYSVHDNNAEKRVKTLRGVRLVSKSWLTGVTNLMKRIKEPMFKLKLTKHNSLEGARVVEAQGKLLDVFAKTIVNRVVKESFPTFSLKLMKEFFRYENFHSLVDFVRLCAEGLVELEMIIPKNGGSLPGGVMTMVDLPILQKLTVQFPDKRVTSNLAGNELEFGNSTNAICLIHSFLSRATSLKEFSVPFGSDDVTFRAPVGFGIVTLPESITSLELSCKLTSDQLKVLTINKLPSLLKLRLLLSDVQYSEGLLSEVLKNLCEHLQNLTISEFVYKGPPRIVNLVRFPVMKELTFLSISASTFELEAEHPFLNECFPKLKFLFIYYQTPEMMRKWTKSVSLVSVEDFRLSLIDENKAEDTPGHILPINLESMQTVNLAFPNIRELTLELSSGTQACGLKYVFMEMRQLIFLSITVHENEAIINSDYWDSIFTGIPISVATGLRENPDFWSHFELKDSATSIRSLTELRTLRLEAHVEARDVLATQPLISDLTFTFALLKMPVLNKLILEGRFSATSAMTEAWKKQGRKLEYS